jgi:flagellar biosynthesis chaperone FliJ
VAQYHQVTDEAKEVKMCGNGLKKIGFTFFLLVLLSSLAYSSEVSPSDQLTSILQSYKTATADLASNLQNYKLRLDNYDSQMDSISNSLQSLKAQSQTLDEQVNSLEKISQTAMMQLDDSNKQIENLSGSLASMQRSLTIWKGMTIGVSIGLVAVVGALILIK